MCKKTFCSNGGTSGGPALRHLFHCGRQLQCEGLHYLPLVSVLVSITLVPKPSFCLKFFFISCQCFFINLMLLCRHLQQPIYWPDKLPSNPSIYQKAYDSLQLKSSQGNHPRDNIDDIFGKGTNHGPVLVCESVLNFCLLHYTFATSSDSLALANITRLIAVMTAST